MNVKRTLVINKMMFKNLFFDFWEMYDDHGLHKNLAISSVASGESFFSVASSTSYFVSGLIYFCIHGFLMALYD